MRFRSVVERIERGVKRVGVFEFRDLGVPGECRWWGVK